MISYVFILVIGAVVAPKLAKLNSTTKIPIFKKNKHRHSIEHLRKPPYPKFRQKLTKFQKVDQNQSLRNSRINRFDLNIDFENEQTPSFDSGSSKTTISEVSPKIDQASKSRSKSISSQCSNRSIRSLRSDRF